MQIMDLRSLARLMALMILAGNAVAQQADFDVPSGINMGRDAHDFELNDYGGVHRLKPLHNPIPLR